MFIYTRKYEQKYNNVAIVLKTESSPLAIYSAEGNGPEIRTEFR